MWKRRFIVINGSFIYTRAAALRGTTPVAERVRSISRGCAPPDFLLYTSVYIYMGFRASAERCNYRREYVIWPSAGILMA